MTRIDVVGLGKLGLPLAALLARASHDVVGVEQDGELLERIVSGAFTSPEPGLVELLKETRIRPATRVSEDAELILVIVPTPSTRREPRFSTRYLRDALMGIHCNARKDAVVGVVSTVMPGTCDGELAKLIPNQRLVYCPQFVAVGDVLRGFRRPDQLMIGSHDHSAANVVRRALTSIVDDEWSPSISMMRPVEVEVAKLAVNSMLAAKIAMGNLITDLCTGFHANAERVMSAVGDDSRIGPKLLRPGLGFCGPCLPRDVRALSSVSSWDLSREISTFNDARMLHYAHAIVKEHKDNSPIAVLGLTYKQNSSLLDDSQALQLAQLLQETRFPVRVHDFDLTSCVGFDLCQDPYDCARSCGSVVLSKLDSRYDFERIRVQDRNFNLWDPWGQA